MLLMQHPQCHAVVLRKVGNTIKNSVYPQVQWGIEQLGVADRFKCITSPHEITYKATGQKILFFGVDDPMKVKSIKLPFGYVGIVWYEELDQFSGMEEIRNLNQSLLRGGEKYWVFASYNPPKSRNNWVNEEILNEHPDRMVHKTTYLDVPREWLGEQFLLEAEKLKAKNETAYNHEYLGEVTGTGGAVFENVEDMVTDDEMISQFDRRYYGLDFGFAVDPLAFVAMHYDAKHEDLYIFDEIYQQKLTNSKAAQLILRKIGSQHIMADSAEPKSIAEMKAAGLFISGGQTALLDAAAPALMLFGLTYITRWFSFATQSFMAAIEKPGAASAISVATALIFPLIFIGVLWPFDLTGLWLNMPATSLAAGALSAVLLVLFFKKQKKTGSNSRSAGR